MARASKGPMSHIVLDEIALEGLEGITIPSLWVYLSAALEMPLPLEKQLQSQIWSFILRAEKHLLFYVLPEERSVVKLFNRFEHLDPFLGVPVQPKECPYPRYKWAPVNDGDIFGSCEYYKERIQIKIEDLLELTVEDVLQKWGSKFVIVGTQDLRFNALTPDNVAIAKDLTSQQYCLFEIIGRSRYNGESTAGSWSLQQFCKDSTFVFYMKSRLVRFGLVSCMTYNEKRSDRLHTSTLMTLPRFFSMHKSVFNAVIEKLVEVLKETPKYRIEYCNARKYFPSMETSKAFKKIAMTHIFRKIFDVVHIPIMEAEDVVKIKEKSRKDRLVLVLQLKNPNISINNELYAENNEAENNEESTEFHCDKHTFVDMPVLDEFYRVIDRHGSRGCSQSEIGNYMATQHSNIRQYVKRGLADGLITSYFADVGRQRTYMYVAAQHTVPVSEKISSSTPSLKNLKCADEPNIPDENHDVICQDTPSITGKIKLHEYDTDINVRETTLRQTQRKALVIQTIDNQGIVSVIDMKCIIHKNEKELGYKDEVCRKSVRRLLGKLGKLGLIKVYEIVLQAEETTRTHRYITHPKISAEHKALHLEMLRLKNSLFLTLEERRFRESNLAKKLEATKIKTSVKKQRKELSQPFATHKSPKFLVSRYLHEFLFYLCYMVTNQRDPIPIDEQLLQKWQQTEPNLDIKDYLETLKLDNKEGNINVFIEEISWRSFIPPLPIYSEKSKGWLLLIDAVIERIPLSLFNKIFRLDKLGDLRIAEYLEHPVRQHYLLKQLPSDMQCKISRAKLQNVYIRIIKLLNNMGLLQVGLRQQKDPLYLWIYLNRHAEILDTTITEASYSKINPNLNYTTLSYVFEGPDDVYQYWTTLHRICLHTRLGFRKVTPPRHSAGKNPYLNFIGTSSFDEAPQNDNCAHTPGDRLGAGGLATHLFSHAFRNWSWVVQTDCKTKIIRKGKQTFAVHPKKNIQNRKIISKSGVGKLSVVPLKRLQMRNVCGSVKRTKKTVPNKKALPRDAIDRDAMKNMRTLRVSWTVEEDEIIKMARAVYLYISAPILLMNFLLIGKMCRDIMRHNLGSFNKTAQACIRRCQFIVKMNRHLPQVPAWLHLLQTNEEMQAQYGDNFLKNLKKAYPNRAELSNALTVHFVKIVNFLYNKVNNYELSDRPTFFIPDTITEFKKKLKESVSTHENTSVKYTNPKTECDLQVAIITNVLHSSLCCTRDKTLYNLQAFEIYKNFSEEVLHEAFQRAHVNGLVIAIKRKHLHSIPTHVTGPTYIFSQKYRMRLTFLKIPYGVYDSFYAFFIKTIETLFGTNTSASPVNKAIELKSPNAGHLYFIGESLASQRWQIDIKLPSSILTVDDTQPESISSSFDRILDHYHDIFENAPETEYIKQIAEEDEKQARIKFQHANLSYKIYYTPYDIISKLPTRTLHFFCALDHLQQEVEINFSKLQHKDDENNVMVIECPFNCIMRNANYINAIERIVQEKKLVLRELQEIETPQQLLNLAVGVNTVTVQPTNLLTLVRMLESFWHEKELALERKDLGKVASTLKKTKAIDWHQMCNEILAYNCNDDDVYNDEYEPTLNKDDRLTRAQDVFVINLPTLILTMSPQCQSSTDIVQYEGVGVPKIFIETAIQKDAIIQKIKDESNWKYTENTLETLKPMLQELNFNAMEIQHLEEIHDYIKSFKLGISVIDLMREFPYDEFLLRALQTLSKHYLIKRVGVSTLMYVHKLHVRPWLVHTFHIKRLEREQLGSTAVTLKRKLKKNKDKAHEDKEEMPAKKKKCKLQEEQPKVVLNDSEHLIENKTCKLQEQQPEVVSNESEHLIANKTRKLQEQQPEVVSNDSEHLIENKTCKLQEQQPAVVSNESEHLIENKTCKLQEQQPAVVSNDSEHFIESKKCKLSPEEAKQATNNTETCREENKVKLVPEKSELETIIETKKRVRKPTKFYIGESETNEETSNVKKDVIVMKPQPWIRLNGSVNRRVLDKWMGSLLTECIARNGCFVHEIFIKFPHMLPADVMFLLEILSDLNCIQLRQIKSVKVGLFSEYEDLKEAHVSEVYNPEDTFVVAQWNALSRFAIFIGKKKYNTEFI